MDAFALLKFWKSFNTSKILAGVNAGDCDEATTVVDSVFSDPPTEYSDYDDEDDDSFFELELTLPKFTNSHPSSNKETDSDLKPNPKPQSPISILRSASPKLRIFTFTKFKKPKRNEDFDNVSVSSINSPKRSDSSLLTVKFKIEDGSIVPKFTRSDSSSLLSPKSSDERYESSKRFSKDVVQKYLNRLKPLKSAKKFIESEKFIGSPTRSTSSFKSPRKEFRKSKSAMATIGAPSPAISRSDHPCDGIESAILHCKRSLNSSNGAGYSSLSRCISDTSHDKSIQVSEEKLKV